MVGESLGKGYVIIFVLIGSKFHCWTWHPLFIIFEAGLGNPFVSLSIDYKVILCVIFESMLPNHWSCHSYVQEKSIWNLYWVGHLQLSILSVSAFPVSSPIWKMLCFTFKLCYLFCVIDGGYIKALLWWFLFCQLHLIIWNQDLEII